MPFHWIHALRGTQAVLSVGVLGLVGYVSSWWTSANRQFPPGEVNFLLFAPIWTLLLLPVFLIPTLKTLQSPPPRLSRLITLLTSFRSKIALVLLETLTMLFWLAGFVSLAVFLTDRICFGRVCSVARAGVALGGVSWGAWLVTAVWAYVGFVGEWKKRRGLEDRDRDVRDGEKGMSGAERVRMHQGV